MDRAPKEINGQCHHFAKSFRIKGDDLKNPVVNFAFRINYGPGAIAITVCNNQHFCYSMHRLLFNFDLKMKWPHFGKLLQRTCKIGQNPALIAFILLTRLWDLGSRAYSHDESIHAWEAWKLATGQGYVHSPTYHGPFAYHFTALIFVLFGDNDVTGRLGAAIFGIALTILPLGLRKWLGTKGLLATTLLMAVSPVLMHRSRFIRHDQFALVFNLVLFIAILHYLDQRKVRDLYIAAAALAFGFTTKEALSKDLWCCACRPDRFAGGSQPARL